MIQVEGLCKRYGDRRAIENLTLQVAPGEVVAIIGPSGAGKTTLLRTLVGLEPFEAGRISCFGRELLPRTNPPELLRELRQLVGYCFQDFQLFPHLTVLENVTLALELVRGLRPQAAGERARTVLARVEMTAFAGAYPGAISGGQKQRVALARALALEPRAVLLDEPVSALDPECVADVVEECRELAANRQAVVVTTHHLPFAKAIAHRVVFMVDGAIVELGTPKQIFEAPSSPRLRQYLAHCLA